MLLIWGFLSAVCLPCDCCRGVVGSAQGSSILKLRDHWMPLQRGHPNPRSINPTPWPEVHKALFDAIAPSGPGEPGLPHLVKRIPLAPRSSNSRRGSLAVMPPGFGPYLPLPRGDGLPAEKGSLVRAAWIGLREGPALTVWLGDPSPDANNPLLNRVHRSAPSQLFETDTK